MGDFDAGPYSALVAELVERRFLVLGDSRDDERFGNSLLLLRRGATRLRVVRDRSQWFLEIAGPGSDDWFGPAVWLAMLDDGLPPAEQLSHDQQANFVLHRLPELDRVSADDSGRSIELLRTWQAQRAASRRAQPPGT